MKRCGIILLIIMTVMVYLKLQASPVDMMIGARGYGFGGAYVAIADDPSAAYWNPARLSQVDNISLMESNWILQDVEGMNVNYISFDVPVEHVGTIAGSWLINRATLEYGETDAGGNLTMNSSGASENIFSLSIGRELFEEFLIFRHLSVGFSMNRYTFYTEAENGAGLGFDLGFSTGFPYGFSIGFTARSIGAEIMGYKLDPEIRFGLGYTKTIEKMHRITAAVDGLYKMNRDYENDATLEPARGNLKGFGGIEYAIWLDPLEISIRGGGNGMALHNTIGNYTFTGGFGVKWHGYSLQYAFIGATERDAALGYGHRISLILELERLFPGQSEESEK